MNKFEKWWQKEEDLMRQQGADNETILGAMRSIAEMAWNAAQPKWQPFETAPKDGTQYLLSMGGRLIICWWCTKIDALVYAGKVIEPARPWLWMPLPAAPQGDEK